MGLFDRFTKAAHSDVRTAGKDRKRWTRKDGDEVSVGVRAASVISRNDRPQVQFEVKVGSRVTRFDVSTRDEDAARTVQAAFGQNLWHMEHNVEVAVASGVNAQRRGDEVTSAYYAGVAIAGIRTYRIALAWGHDDKFEARWDDHALEQLWADEHRKQQKQSMVQPPRPVAA